MPLGMKVGLGPGHIALAGVQLSLRKGHNSPHPTFLPIVARQSPISATAELLLKYVRVAAGLCMTNLRQWRS